MRSSHLVPPILSRVNAPLQKHVPATSGKGECIDPHSWSTRLFGLCALRRANANGPILKVQPLDHRVCFMSRMENAEIDSHSQLTL